LIFNKGVLAVILTKPIYCCKVGVAGAADYSINSRFAMPKYMLCLLKIAIHKRLVWVLS